MAFSKVVLNDVTLMDVTSDTVESSNLLTGYTATSANGEKIVGTATGGSTPSLQTKSKTYTPTESQQTETIAPDSAYDGLEEVDITVNAISSSYVGTGVTRRDWQDVTFDVGEGSVSVPSGYYEEESGRAMPEGAVNTPSATKGTVSNHSVSVTPSVTYTAGCIGSGSKTGTAVSVSASELVSGTYSVTSSGTKDVTNYASASVPAGVVTAPSTISGTSATVSTGTNTLTLSKTVSVTPSVSTAGYVSSGTAGNANVSLTGSVTTKAAATITPGTTNQTIASGTYLTGTQTISGDANLVAGNIKKDTSIFGVTGTYEGSGGGGGTIQVATATKTLSSASSSIQFTGLSGEPTSFVVTSSSDQTTGGTKVVGVVYDGTSLHGIDITTQAEADTGFTKSYSSGTLTITATTASFQANEYKIVYTYGGSTSDIGTEDVQVGSGATSITFTGLTEEPNYWSCIFKSSFSTSSGYQRVMIVAHDSSSTYGFAFDSSAKAQTTWTSSYSNGSLTITSSGTNSGGYFHQPGYYQLTYATDPNAPSLQVKTGIGASTSSQTITADTGYDGLKSVQINAVSQTNLSAENIKNGTTISISNGTSNLWSVTGTYEGSGGGGSGLTLLKTTSLGTLSTSSTSASDTGKTMTVTGYNDYDVLVVDVSVDTATNGRHTSTVSMVYLTGTSNVSTKNTYTVGSNKWNSKLGSTGTGSTRQSTSAYGIYVNAATVSSSTMTLTFYYRYNSNNTGTINGSYTARVYGLKLYELIGG